MKKRRFPWLLCLLLILIFAAAVWFIVPNMIDEGGDEAAVSKVEEFIEDATDFVSRGYEPKEVRELRQQEVAQTDEGHQEYYFQQLNDAEKRAYREMLSGIRNRQAEFYLTTADDTEVDRAYHAVLNDHPELFWVHNREQVYKTTYKNSDYCLFSPGYSYTDSEITEIQNAMENAYQEVVSMIPDGSGVYEKIKIVYTYLIDNTEYAASEHDQNIAGTFWKRETVCAGYAAGMQYLLERLGISCIYVEGNTKDTAEGHAWNIVEIDGQYYYVDVTNGDQPNFLEGDAVELVEHKTTMYDYLCPFPEEYEMTYTPLSDFAIPECTAVDKNFYVLNQGCFDSYDWQTLYDYCCMRLNNGAAVVRFKFSNQEAFDQAYAEWIEGGEIQSAARYYLQLYGMSEVEYHYGILDNLKTMYFMF